MQITRLSGSVLDANQQGHINGTKKDEPDSTIQHRHQFKSWPDTSSRDTRHVQDPRLACVASRTNCFERVHLTQSFTQVTLWSESSMRTKELFTLELSSDLNYVALTSRLNELTKEIKKHVRMPKTTLQIVVLKVVDKRWVATEKSSMRLLKSND